MNFSVGFKNNHLKDNPEKFHIFNCTKNPEFVSINGIPLTASSKKLLGVTIDQELKFEDQITESCVKVSKNLNALCCISSFMSIEKRRTQMKAFT